MRGENSLPEVGPQLVAKHKHLRLDWAFSMVECLSNPTAVSSQSQEVNLVSPEENQIAITFTF